MSAPPTDAPWDAFPQTRYQGSKRKLLPVLAQVFSRLEFDSALDPFCGTGSVAYLLKCLGKTVTASDLLASNAIAARALVENDGARLGPRAKTLVCGLPAPSKATGFIETEFNELFFEQHENRFLDQILTRIHGIDDETERALALYALNQACLAKRPYNLFHRANLSMRRRNVARSFGNKKTWDTPFPLMFERYASEADNAVFCGSRPARAECLAVEEISAVDYDLVYLDPPYVSARGTGVDYLDFYHFLEGLAAPGSWGDNILHKYKHKPLRGKGTSPWADPLKISRVFEATLKKFSKSTLVISYRSDGLPSIETISQWLRTLGKSVEICDSGNYTYALSKNRTSREIILIAK